MQTYNTSQTLLSIAPPALPHLMSWLSILVLLPVLVLYRIERRMVALFGLVMVLLLVVGSSYAGEVFQHYVLLIYFVPVLLLLGGIFRFSRNKLGYTSMALCLFAVLGSIAFNVQQDINLVHIKQTAPSLANIEDKTKALSLVPAGATICVIRDAPLNSMDLKYIDSYSPSRHQFTFDCKPGDYQIAQVDAPIEHNATTKTTNKHIIQQIQ